jgi:hypothetical protein
MCMYVEPIFADDVKASVFYFYVIYFNKVILNDVTIINENKYTCVNKSRILKTELK